MPQAQQCGIRATSANYTTTQGNAGSLTHLVRPGNEPATSWFLVGFVSSAPRRELLKLFSPIVCVVLLLFLTASFSVQKLVTLIKSLLLIFVFISFGWGDLHEKTFVRFMSENVLPMFSSRSF